MMKRAVFLDRDGVVIRATVRNGKPYPPDSLAHVELSPGIEGGLAQLHLAGYLLILITNQPDVARGIQSRETAEAINHHLLARLPIDDCLACYHDDSDDCDCRKPRPGLILRAAERFDIDIENSFLVGDRWRDVEAGLAAGCRTVLIDYGYQEKAPAREPDVRLSCFAEAVEWMLTHESSAVNSRPHRFREPG